MVARHPHEPRCRPGRGDVGLALGDRDQRVGVAVQQQRRYTRGRQGRRVADPVALGNGLRCPVEQVDGRPAAEALAGGPCQRRDGGLADGQGRWGCCRPGPRGAGRQPPAGGQPQGEVAAGGVPDHGGARRVDPRRVAADHQVVMAGSDIEQSGRPGRVGGRVVDVPDEETVAGQVGGNRVLQRPVVRRPPEAPVHQEHRREPAVAALLPRRQPPPAALQPAAAVRLDGADRPGHDLRPGTAPAQPQHRSQAGQDRAAAEPPHRLPPGDGPPVARQGVDSPIGP